MTLSIARRAWIPNACKPLILAHEQRSAGGVGILAKNKAMTPAAAIKMLISKAKV